MTEEFAGWSEDQDGDSFAVNKEGDPLMVMSGQDWFFSKGEIYGTPDENGRVIFRYGDIVLGVRALSSIGRAAGECWEKVAYNRKYGAIDDILQGRRDLPPEIIAGMLQFAERM